MSGGGPEGALAILVLVFLLISGDCLGSCPLRLRHSLTQLWEGLAAWMTSFLETYSSWPVVSNSNMSNFCSLSK